MDWVTALPQRGDRIYNECLVLVDRYSKTPIFLPCHKDDTAMETAIIIWNKVICHTGLFLNILSFSTAYHPQTDGLAEKMIWTLEDIIRRFCAYGLKFKDSDGFTHDWSILEKGWNPRLPYDTLKNNLVDINPTARSLKIMLDKAGHHPNRFMQNSFKYAKERRDKSQKPPDFEVGDLVLVSTLNVNKIKVPNKLKDSFSGPFMIKELHGPNAVRLELTGEIMNKHPAFPVSLIKPYRSSKKE
ncbi:hypothetical protein O181_063579 [Austropuccinia psidii MF-1]|uniref:Tf2-1-like SH3-like domain-containing protein n=1 Tax=Austropuccinia psidii MF-1 TaxID=1389203 RepID=A0A9Q3EMQ4_9BASI|nr:hypothetical protein [Austropuccinia psidii MF-1]